MPERSLKKGYLGASCCCACGSDARFVEHRPKKLVSLFGEIHTESPYYHCADCGTGMKPWEEKLRVGPRRLTKGAEEVVSMAGAMTSFGRAAEKTLPTMCGLRLSESTVQRVSEDAGQEIADAWVEKKTFGGETPWQWQHDAEQETCGYVGVDHVSIPQQGPNGAKAESRMAVVGILYNPQSEHDEELPRGYDERRLLAGFYELDDFGLVMRRQAAQIGWDDLQQQLAVSDAGQGLEDWARKGFPRATSILDFYHASQHVAKLATALHPQDALAAQEQTTTWCHQLKHEGGSSLRHTIEQLSLRGSAAWRETHHQVLQYFRNHEHRMDYPSYRQHGWQIGSGPVESACKRVVTQRLKGAGMRWSKRGSHAMSHLCALHLSQSNQWSGFWARKSSKSYLLI